MTNSTNPGRTGSRVLTSTIANFAGAVSAVSEALLQAQRLKASNITLSLTGRIVGVIKWKLFLRQLRQHSLGELGDGLLNRGR